MFHKLNAICFKWMQCLQYTIQSNDHFHRESELFLWYILNLWSRHLQVLHQHLRTIVLQRYDSNTTQNNNTHLSVLHILQDTLKANSAIHQYVSKSSWLVTIFGTIYCELFRAECWKALIYFDGFKLNSNLPTMPITIKNLSPKLAFS